MQAFLGSTLFISSLPTAYWAVLVLVGLESMGIPVPGETVLVSAAIYAGTAHGFHIRSSSPPRPRCDHGRQCRLLGR